MFKLFSASASLQTGAYFYFTPARAYVKHLRRHQIATGAGDDTIRIWDMRSLKALYTIPAHLSNVSDVRFFYAQEAPVFTQHTATGDVEMKDVAVNGEDSNQEKDKPSTDGNPSISTASLEEEWKYRSGLYLASSGYDGLVKLWSADDWQLLRTLPTDGGKVMSVDLSGDSKLLASGTYNRNFQIFAPEELPI